LKKTDKEIKEIKLKKLFVVMNYDYEDPDWSSVEFIGLSKDECYDWIDENFEDYYEDEWNEDEDGLFSSRGDDNWLKSKLHLEIKELNEVAISDSLKELLK
jgi:hypothetical protein